VNTIGLRPINNSLFRRTLTACVVFAYSLLLCLHSKFTHTVSARQLHKHTHTSNLYVQQVAGLLRAAAVVGPAQSTAVVAATAPLLAQRLWLCDAAQMACPLVRAAMLDLLELTSTTVGDVGSDSSDSSRQHEAAVASASDALRKATAQVLAF
jgi:hypothetical protein